MDQQTGLSRLASLIQWVLMRNITGLSHIRQRLSRLKKLRVKGWHVFRRMALWRQIALCLIVILLLVGAVGKTVLSIRPTPEAQYYTDRLESIRSNIDDTKTMLNEGETLADPALLSSYADNLNRIISDCADIIKRAENTPENIAKSAKSSAQLCNDLLAVARYQEELYGQLKSLIEYRTHMLTDVNDENFPSRVKVFNNIVFTVQTNISKLDNRRVNDPGLNEIIDVLADLQTKSNIIQSNIDAAKADPTELNKLVKRTQDIQQDLLLRRGYFWNNTVDVNRLQRVLDRQLEQFR